MPVRFAVASGNFSSTATWNGGATLGIPTGSDDIWTNTFTVNVNQSFDALTLNNTARARDIATPQMTGANTPNPYAAAASGESVGFEAWRAFDRVYTRTSGWGVATSTGWLSMDFGSGNSVVIDGYTIFGSSTQAQNPRNWSLQGSNNNTSWTDVHIVSGAAAIGASSDYVATSIGNTTGYRYYRINVTLNGGSVQLAIVELELYQQFTGTITAGGSFNFNSGSISGSVTSATPLSAGATNLITVTATTGSVGLTLGGAVSSPAIASTNLISHTGNCDFRLSGITFNTALTGLSSHICINKSSLGTIIITGSLNAGNPGGGQNTNHALSSTAGNTIILGNVVGGGGSGTVARGVNQTAGNLTVIGNVVGGLGSGTGQEGINFTGTSISIIGNIVGTSVQAGTNTTSPITVTGNVSGSAAAGITTTAPVIVTGSVVAQGAAAAINAGANVVFINVSGSVIASATSNAISATNASAVVNLAGNIINVNGKQAIYCQNLFLDNTATTQAQFFTFGGSDRTLYSADTFPNLPSASNVRFGTTYGPGSGNTGTLRMASSQDVRSGVLTDNTTGSAILSMESLSNEIQISTDPFAQRLRNISTVDTVGYLLTAFKK
jgi:hypothetical protein